MRNNNSVANEQCDPADPSHEGWWDQWCSASCEPINQVIDPPTCELLYTNIGNDDFLIHWYIDGSFSMPTYIYIAPDTVEETTHAVLTNNGTWNHVSVEAPGIYTATLTVSNSAWSSTCQKAFVVEAEANPELIIDKIFKQFAFIRSIHWVIKPT